MYCSTLVVIVFLQELLFLTGITLTNSQRTNARQATNKIPPTVAVPGQGTLIGKEILLARPQKVTAFLGIPYAQPPIGQRRFAPPVTDPIVSWSGPRNATQFAPSCHQDLKLIKHHEMLYRKLLPSDWEDPGYSEDCLFLNLYIPDDPPPTEGWPVMVWFHGGDFNTGTPAIWDATVFVNKQKILVVTVAYRLNIFGFFTTTTAEAPGNYGMLDQVAALDWVQQNIQHFNGSHDNVVIAGHNAGAISVGLHIVSPLSKGKFAKAITMSGDPISTVRTPELEAPIADQVGERFACFIRNRTRLIECLRRVQASVLLRETADIETWGPIIDITTTNSTDPFLPMSPRDILETGNFNAVPLMAGFTSNEQSLAYLESLENPGDEGKMTFNKFDSLIRDEILALISGTGDNSSTCESKPQMVADAVLFFYKPYPQTEDTSVYRDRYLALQTDKNYAASLTLLASRVSRQKETFVYRFDYRPITQLVVRDIPEWAGVPHMFELPFVWGLPHMFGSSIVWRSSDKNLADVMMRMVGKFIRSGNPTLDIVQWDPFNEQSPGILTINRTISKSDVEAIDHRILAFWNDYYPSLIQETMNFCCNATNAAEGTHFENKFYGIVIGTLILLYI
ncbi:carboxylesterase 1C-like isoform X1 [Cotesia glomerata]|uniref:carboxylesterase 1C-like isoform X1 n=2 Tax=Cotesia glomerata TaxID=32391 RepID=UPI001D01910A|nr:carboxylesterase 1C-like isoform X1 [Cotesia glomerata]